MSQLRVDRTKDEEGRSSERQSKQWQTRSDDDMMAHEIWDAMDDSEMLAILFAQQALRAPVRVHVPSTVKHRWGQLLHDTRPRVGLGHLRARYAIGVPVLPLLILHRLPELLEIQLEMLPVIPHCLLARRARARERDHRDLRARTK